LAGEYNFDRLTGLEEQVPVQTIDNPRDYYKTQTFSKEMVLVIKKRRLTYGQTTNIKGMKPIVSFLSKTK